MKKVSIFSIALFAAAVSLAPAWASPRDEVLSGVARCGTISDDRMWLDCFYGSAQPLRARLGLPAAPQAQIRLSAPIAPGQPVPIAPPPAPQGRFGADSLANQPVASPAHDVLAGTPSRIALRMTSYTFDRDGRFTVTLSNGQVWRQNSNDGLKAGWKKPPAEYPVTIRRGFFGDYNLSTVDGGGAHKVDRIR